LIQFLHLYAWWSQKHSWNISKIPDDLLQVLQEHLEEIIWDFADESERFLVPSTHILSVSS
jgi:hypothetical protein